MKISGMVDVAQFRNKYASGSAASTITEAQTITQIEARPSTDEEKLNQTEKAFLAILRERGYPALKIHAITLKLADDTRYTPEFSAVVEGRIVLFEVKGGFIREDAWIKLKVAARMYPEYDFVMAQYKDKKWIETPIKP